MNDSLQYHALSRLLALNNQVHDLEVQLQRESVPSMYQDGHLGRDAAPMNRIAAMQEEIDQGVRATLVTCWLGMSGDSEE